MEDCWKIIKILKLIVQKQSKENICAVAVDEADMSHGSGKYKLK